MALPTRQRPKKRTPRSSGAEYRFKIDAYTPATMPMARLAEYMGELAKMLGEPSAVHFERLEPGSTVLIHKVDHEAAPKIRERVSAVRRGEAPADAERAFKAVNKLLREDNGKGVLQEGARRSAIVIRFPGIEAPEETFPTVRESGTIDGIITWIGGSDDTIHVTLEVGGRQISRCYTNRRIGKRLGPYIFEPVRLSGQGSWSREPEGGWTLKRFRIDDFEVLSGATLSEALADIRQVQGEWQQGDYEELDLIRHGPGGKTNGGH